ncbi:MAG: hypothetical protein KDD63_19630, partial [Bacteroidetes bacterium]|nr:hypothetical protein [Bacteroidota bacterium]
MRGPGTTICNSEGQISLTNPQGKRKFQDVPVDPVWVTACGGNILPYAVLLGRGRTIKLAVVVIDLIVQPQSPDDGNVNDDLHGVSRPGDVVTRLIIAVQVDTGGGTIEVGGNDGAEDRRIKHIPRRSSYRGLTDGRAQAGNGR